MIDASDAWCQLASSLRLDELIAAGDRLVGWPRPLLSINDVDAAIVRFGSRRGARALRAAREEMRPGSASPRETRLRLWATRAGFPEPECNGAVEIPDGPTLHGDLVFRARRVILEYDGDQHRDVEQFRRDIGRLNALALAGWTVIRVSRNHTRAQVLNDLARALA